jgi:hypothetical protein
MTSYLFRAASLGSKFGFHDGEMLEDFLDQRLEMIGNQIGWSSHPLLIACVRKFLLPALGRPVEVEEIDSNHNPIRLAEKETLDGIEHIEVEVTEAEIEEVLSDLCRSGVYPAASSPGTIGKDSDHE